MGTREESFPQIQENNFDSIGFLSFRKQGQRLHVTTHITSCRTCHSMVRWRWSSDPQITAINPSFSTFKISRSHRSCPNNVYTPRGNPNLLILGTTESEKALRISFLSEVKRSRVNIYLSRGHYDQRCFRILHYIISPLHMHFLGRDGKLKFSNSS